PAAGRGGPGGHPIRAILLRPAKAAHRRIDGGVCTVTPWARRLLIANVAMFLVMVAAPPALVGFINALVLVPAYIVYRPWTIVTYAFLHADVLHLLFNMIGLFFFGPRLE